MNVIALLDKYESKKLKKFYYIFLPFFYVIEYYAYKKYWNLIISELLTNDEIMKWLDENEFGFDGQKIYKKDLIEPNSFFDNFDTNEIAIKVRIEFVKKVSQLLRENLIIDIENYINLEAYADRDTEYLMKYYTVEIRYYRYPRVKKNFKYFLMWLISFVLIIVAAYKCLSLWIN